MLFCLYILFSTSSGGLSELTSDLKAIVEHESQKYNCSVALSIKSLEDSVTVASGSIDEFGTPGNSSMLYTWGSITKPLTGATILRLQEKGLLNVNDHIVKYIDPFLKKMRTKHPDQNIPSSLRDLFGIKIELVTIQDLATMTLGAPDFDTAKPDVPPTDEFRELMYKNPEKYYTPIDILNLDWVKGQKLHRGYSSTNFMLLGFVIAQVMGLSSWEELDQRDLLPKGVDAIFGIEHTPVYYSPVRGLDRTSYNNHTGQIDTGVVAGTFAGWTASDIIMNVENAAKLFWEIYASESSFLSSSSKLMMIPESHFYGFATFNLSGATGQNGTYGISYGHLGATYGYQSIAAYLPGVNVTIAVATNLETMHQEQPADTFCIAYNRVKNYLLNEPVSTCQYHNKGYFPIVPGSCTCSS